MNTSIVASRIEFKPHIVLHMDRLPGRTLFLCISILVHDNDDSSIFNLVKTSGTLSNHSMDAVR